MSTENRPMSTSFEVRRVNALDDIDQQARDGAVDTYRRAFAEEPYNESFAPGEVRDRFRAILERQGDLLFGDIDGEVVTFAGGYMKADGIYFIEELAVAPEYQRRGLGRTTLDHLLRAAAPRSPKRLEVRTTANNKRAIQLYESEGFTKEVGPEAVPERRQDGAIRVDERVYLSKPPTPEAERVRSLKRVAIVYPSGNATALVFDQLTDADRKALNDGLMATWKAKAVGQPELEQCGFVSVARDPKAVARVEMLGGEFCGNATRSAIWMVTGGQDYEGWIEASGVVRPLWFQVKDQRVTVEMPLPQGDQSATSVDEGTLVQLDGIAQLVVDATGRTVDASPRQLLTELLGDNRYQLADQPAVGVTFYDQRSSKAHFCVWVNEVDTIFDETACGSGTCAIGIAAAVVQCASVNLNVIQPSGETISTQASLNSSGQVVRSLISGNVVVLYDGELELL